MPRATTSSRRLFKLISSLIIHALILNDLSFAIADPIRHLSPPDRFNATVDIGQSESLMARAAFRSVATLIGDYLRIGISEHTTRRHTLSRAAGLIRILDNARSPSASTDPAQAAKIDAVLRDLAIDQLTYHPQDNSFTIPQYRSGKLNCVYRFSTSGDAAAADDVIPLAGGASVHVTVEGRPGGGPQTDDKSIVQEKLLERAIMVRRWMDEYAGEMQKHQCYGVGIIEGLAIDGGRTVESGGLISHCWAEVGDGESGWLVDASFNTAPPELRKMVLSSERFMIGLRDDVLVMPLKEARAIYGSGRELDIRDYPWRTARQLILGDMWSNDNEHNIGTMSGFDEEIMALCRKSLSAMMDGPERLKTTEQSVEAAPIGTPSGPKNKTGLARIARRTITVLVFLFPFLRELAADTVVTPKAASAVTRTLDASHNIRHPLYQTSLPYITLFEESALTNEFAGLTRSFQGSVAETNRSTVGDYGSSSYDMANLGLIQLYHGDTNIIDTLVGNWEAGDSINNPIFYFGTGYTNASGQKVNGLPFTFARILGRDVPDWWNTWIWEIDTGSSACMITFALDAYSKTGNSRYLNFAIGQADTLLMLQDTDGGFRYAPIGVYHDSMAQSALKILTGKDARSRSAILKEHYEKVFGSRTAGSADKAGSLSASQQNMYTDYSFFWNIKSTEKNERILIALQNLNSVTNYTRFAQAATNLQDWLVNMYNPHEHLFHTAAQYNSASNSWIKSPLGTTNEYFATDVTALAPIELMLKDERFGATQASRDAEVDAMFSATEARTAFKNADGEPLLYKLSGSQSGDYGSVEFSAQMALAYLKAAQLYSERNPERSSFYLWRYQGLNVSLRNDFFNPASSNAAALVAPYASYLDGSIAGGVPTGTGYYTEVYEAALASGIWIGFALSGFDPSSTNGGAGIPLTGPIITGTMTDPTNSDLVVTIKDPPGASKYDIYYKDALTNGAWRVAETNYPVSKTGTTIWRDGGGSDRPHPSQAPKRFYRAVIAPDSSSGGFGLNGLSYYRIPYDIPWYMLAGVSLAAAMRGSGRKKTASQPLADRPQRRGQAERANFNMADLLAGSKTPARIIREQGWVLDSLIGEDIKKLQRLAASLKPAKELSAEGRAAIGDIRIIDRAIEEKTEAFIGTLEYAYGDVSRNAIDRHVVTAIIRTVIHHINNKRSIYLNNLEIDLTQGRLTGAGIAAIRKALRKMRALIDRMEEMDHVLTQFSPDSAVSLGEIYIDGVSRPSEFRYTVSGKKTHVSELGQDYTNERIGRMAKDSKVVMIYDDAERPAVKLVDRRTVNRLYKQGRLTYRSDGIVARPERDRVETKPVEQNAEGAGGPRSEAGKTEAPKLGLTPRVNGETVGILRIIPDVIRNYKELWNIKDNEIAAVDFYPTADPTFVRPMGIITSEIAAGLSHAEVRARYWGIPHAAVDGLDRLKELEGKWVYMKVSESGVELRLATAEEAVNYKSYQPKKPKPTLEEVDLTTKANILSWLYTKDPKVVSHKFAGLHKIPTQGPSNAWRTNVGSVIPFATWKRALDANPGLEDKLRSIIATIDNEEIDDIETKLTQARGLIENMDIPESIWGNAEKEKGGFSSDWSIDYTIMNETYNGGGVFIRCGTNAEDLPDYPGFGAGQYGTFPNVMRKDAKLAVKKAWASVWNRGAYIERQKFGLDHFSVYPAVQISHAIDAKYAFVVHTADPEGADQDKVVIEIVQGLGEALVGDKYPGDAHRYVYSKSQDKIISFEPATRNAKAKSDEAVLNPAGGLMRAPTDYSDDIFIRDGANSGFALLIARTACGAERSALRPQDMEGAIEPVFNDYRAVFTQSRSQVGYAKMQEPWEEYFEANREWALGTIAKYRDLLKNGLPDISLKVILESIIKECFIIDGESTSDASGLARRLRLFHALGEDGRRFAGRLLVCGRGVHAEFKSAMMRLPAPTVGDLFAHAAVDYDILDKNGQEAFAIISNFNVARIVAVMSSDWPDGLKEAFSRMPPDRLASLIAEVLAFHSKPKDDFEVGDFKRFKWSVFAQMIKDIYAAYDESQKRVFSDRISRSAAANIGIPKKLREERRLTDDERRRLFDWSYYKFPQAVVLAASTIDGAEGMESFFASMRFGFYDKENPFHFFLLMDIPGEKAEDFLRRNGLKGEYFAAVIEPSDIAAGYASAILSLQSGYDQYGNRAKLKGDAIVFVGPDGLISRYCTEENGILKLPAEPQRGVVPFVISDAIRLLHDSHKASEERLGAWLTSRGLDGTKRYKEWCYEAERYLEGCRDKAAHDRLAKRILSYDKEIGPSDDDDLMSAVRYMAEKDAASTATIFVAALAKASETKREKAYQFMRELGFASIKTIALSTAKEPGDGSEAISSILEHIRREAVFPRDAKELEELLAHTKPDELPVHLCNLYAYCVKGVSDEPGLTHEAAETAVAKGFCRNYDVSSRHSDHLTNIITAHPELLPWLQGLLAKTGANYEITTEARIIPDGSASRYIVREKPSERKLRAEARRQRWARGDDVDPATLTDEDFDEWPLSKAPAWTHEFYIQDMPRGEPSPFVEHYDSWSFVEYLGHSMYDFNELGNAQDMIECMYRDDDGYAKEPKVFSQDDQVLASVTLSLYGITHISAEDARRIFSSAPPKLIADMAHYASQRENNRLIRENTINDPPKIRRALATLIEAQNENRRAAIERYMSPQAREFLKPPPPVEKRKSKAELFKEERAKRKELARKAMADRGLTEPRDGGNGSEKPVEQNAEGAGDPRPEEEKAGTAPSTEDGAEDQRRLIFEGLRNCRSSKELLILLKRLSYAAIAAGADETFKLMDVYLSEDFARLIEEDVSRKTHMSMHDVYMNFMMLFIDEVAERYGRSHGDEIVRRLTRFTISFMGSGMLNREDVSTLPYYGYTRKEWSIRNVLAERVYDNEELQDLIYRLFLSSEDDDIAHMRSYKLAEAISYMLRGNAAGKWREKVNSWIPGIIDTLKGPRKRVNYHLNKADILVPLVRLDPARFNDRELLDVMADLASRERSDDGSYYNFIIFQIIADYLAENGGRFPDDIYRRFAGKDAVMQRFLNWLPEESRGIMRKFMDNVKRAATNETELLSSGDGHERLMSFFQQTGSFYNYAKYPERSFRFLALSIYIATVDRFNEITSAMGDLDENLDWVRDDCVKLMGLFSKLRSMSPFQRASPEAEDEARAMVEEAITKKEMCLSLLDEFHEKIRGQAGLEALSISLVRFRTKMSEYFDELNIRYGSILDTPGTVGALSLSATPEAERIHAIELTDTLKIAEAANLKQPVILALGTSWMKGYKPGEPVYRDMNKLIAAIDNYCAEKGIAFVRGEDSELMSKIEEEKLSKNISGAKVIVLAAKESILPDGAALASLKNDENAFLAAVDSEELDPACYIRLCEMLRMALELGLKDLFDDRIDINNPNIKVDPVTAFRNVYLFLPRAERIPVYERLHELYHVQEFA